MNRLSHANSSFYFGNSFSIGNQSLQSLDRPVEDDPVHYELLQYQVCCWEVDGERLWSYLATDVDGYLIQSEAPVFFQLEGGTWPAIEFVSSHHVLGDPVPFLELLPGLRLITAKSTFDLLYCDPRCPTER